ncbi:hypothetical protein RhiirB3_455867 [Rhizophagus irregularis]|nr:hypothetical protein RhiirB3_455867 [Rhizophagus irregularis]
MFRNTANCNYSAIVYLRRHSYLQKSLEILKFKDSVRTNILKEGAAFSNEPFTDSLLGPLNKDAYLQQDILLLLADFYHNIYNKDFVILLQLHNTSDESIPVLPKVN